LALASDQAEGIIFKEHATGLATSIRECKYNLGMGYDDEDDADTDAKAGKGRKDLSGLSYRGHGLANPPEKIKAQLMKCLTLAGAIKAGDADESGNVVDLNEKYGELSAEFMDALNDIHGDMISANDTKEAGSEGPSESEWVNIEAFARELSICMNVERNLVLLWKHMVKLDGLEAIGSPEARKTCRPEEGMRYCDLLKEDLESLKELPETSSSISSALSLYIQVALNCRCFFLALCHSLTGKTLESAALFDMLRSRTEDTALEKALEEPLGRLHPLFERVVKSTPTRVSQWRCRSLAQLCSKAPKGKGEDQEGQDASAAAASFPPRVRDIPCKPLLFDLAFPCMEAPDLEEILPKNRSSQGSTDGEKKAGLLGKVGGGVANVAGGLSRGLSGLWGRGKKDETAAKK